MDALATTIAIGHDLFFNSEDEKELLIKQKKFAEIEIPNMSNKQFKYHFRLSRETFENLMEKANSLSKNYVHPGREPISLTKQFLMTIWYIANIESFRAIALRFDVSKSSAWTVLYNVCMLLIEMNKKYNIITWPNAEEAERNMIEFQRKTRFPGVIGAIDGSHIPIKSPSKNAASYINRKGFHSIILQAVCNNHYKLLDVYCGEVGSIHNSMVLRRPDFYKKLPNNNCFPNDGHILGDSAYALNIRIMFPYKDLGNLNAMHKNYNVIHSKTRVVIEQCFALLKGRFRRLNFIETQRVELIPLIIFASCILHNLCIINQDVWERVDLDLANEERAINDHFPYPSDQPINQVAKQKRDAIARLLL